MPVRTSVELTCDVVGCQDTAEGYEDELLDEGWVIGKLDEKAICPVCVVVLTRLLVQEAQQNGTPLPAAKADDELLRELRRKVAGRRKARPFIGWIVANCGEGLTGAVRLAIAATAQKVLNDGIDHEHAVRDEATEEKQKFRASQENPLTLSQRQGDHVLRMFRQELG